MQPVLLRRTKGSTIDGEAVVKLPPREQQLVRKPFSASEQRFYDQVQQESMQKLKVPSSFTTYTHLHSLCVLHMLVDMSLYICECVHNTCRVHTQDA